MISRFDAVGASPDMTHARHQESAETVLRLTNLTKHVGDRLLLDIPELTIARGSITVLLGRNGSGKTTLLKILSGLLRPDHANVQLGDGPTLGWQNARRQLRRQTIYLHQAPYLFDRTVAGNIAYGLHCKGLRRAALRAQVRSALRWAGLEHLHDRDARQLSGGEKQRVALTRARILTPAILLLDEPVANMDQEAREQTCFLIRRLSSEGTALIITSHEHRNISRLADRVLNLNDGHLSPCSPEPQPGLAKTSLLPGIGSPVRPDKAR